MAYVDRTAGLTPPVGRGLRVAGGGQDAEPVAKPSFVAQVAGWVLEHPLWLYAIIRRVAPIVVFRGWGFVARFDDVQEALRRDGDFAVPFGPKVELLNDGPNFLLGMGDGEEYRRVRALVKRVFPAEDNPNVVAPMSYRLAEALLQQNPGRIDAVADLITRVPTQICEQYYGVAVADERRFAHLAIVMSTFMFGDPTDNPALRVRAVEAGAEFRDIIEAAIARGRQATPRQDTILGRLLAIQAAEPAVSDGDIRAILIGMITGFVPTNTMAAGHMLEVLLRRPDALAQAQSRARADDDEGLRRCLLEAFRFMPLNPGPFRVCPADATLAEGTPRAKRIPKGTRLLVGTQSAMFDPRRIASPDRFDPDRDPQSSMLFGYGLHWCVGAPLADAQITQTFKALLKRPNLRRAPGPEGRLGKDGPFPAHLVVEYDG